MTDARDWLEKREKEPREWPGCNRQIKRPLKVVYVHGHLPIFQHLHEDLASFRLITSQMIVNGTVGQAEIVRAFGVPLATVKRYVQIYRKARGESLLYCPATAIRGAAERRRAGTGPSFVGYRPECA